MTAAGREQVGGNQIADNRSRHTGDRCIPDLFQRSRCQYASKRPGPSRPPLH